MPLVSQVRPNRTCPGSQREVIIGRGIAGKMRCLRQIVVDDGYEIRQTNDGRYWKIPPPTIDPNQTPISMPLKTRNLRDLATAHERATEHKGAAERYRAAELLSAPEWPEPVPAHSTESQ